MAVHEVLRMGDPRLLQVAERVTAFDTPQLHALIQDMTDTMRALDGAGLAAPQIGVPLQVVIFEVQNNPRYPEAEPVPFTVLINPELTPLTDAMEEGWEGCLSLPGLRGKVPRYTTLRYRGFDPSGRPIERTVTGFHARVVQHETDHLHGILYPMRMRDHGSRAGLAFQGEESETKPYPGLDRTRSESWRGSTVLQGGATHLRDFGFTDALFPALGEMQGKEAADERPV